MMGEWITVIAAIVTSVTSYFIGKSANKTDLAKAEKESKALLEKDKQTHDSDLEKFYAMQMTTIISEYKEQVSGLRMEIDKLRSDFTEFQKRHEMEVTGYKLYIDQLEEENEGLKVEVEHLNAELEELKGGI